MRSWSCCSVLQLVVYWVMFFCICFLKLGLMLINVCIWYSTVYTVVIDKVWKMSYALKFLSSTDSLLTAVLYGFCRCLVLNACFIAVATRMIYWWHQEGHSAKITLMLQKKSLCMWRFLSPGMCKCTCNRIGSLWRKYGSKGLVEEYGIMMMGVSN